MQPECYYPLTVINALFRPEENTLGCMIELETMASTYSISFWYYLLVFGLTCLLESPIYYFFLKIKFHLGQIRRTHFLLKLLWLNLATHPIAIWVVPYAAVQLEESVLWSVVVAEFFAVSVELLILRLVFKYSWYVSFWAALLANILSWTVGIWLQVMQIF